MESDQKRRFCPAVVCTALCCGSLLSACGGGGSDAASVPASTSPAKGAAINEPNQNAGKGPATAANAPGKNASQGDFAPTGFAHSLVTGANPFLPLKPGIQTTREGQVNVGSRRLPHRVVTTVTDVVKPIDGVRATVVLDQDFNGGQLAEQALDYVAEDKQGNVWYLGSYTETYEGGQFVTATDAWLAGVNGAEPGLLMLADPQTGTPAYSERTVPGLEATSSQVVAAGESQCVPYKCYKDVLVIEEDAAEHKLYAPGVGQISTEPLSSDGKEEVEKLVNLTTLSPPGLAEVSAAVLKLDQHAKVVAPDVFAASPSAQRSG